MERLYGSSPALLTDLYQLTMAYAYWKAGLTQRRAVFHLFFRNCPFGGQFALAAGLEQAIEFINRLRFEPDDLAYLAAQTGNDGRPLFEPAFLDHLAALRLACDIDALPEGTPVFPHEPLLRVEGPILDCQLLETPLLCLINFPTLIATKAARIVMAADGTAVVEFGLRRAQGFEAALTAARAAYVGGCIGTSNVLAGRQFGIPVFGTHAHSWVMCFEHEQQAFAAYADALPNNCVLLVDTYDTLHGVRNAIEAARRLRSAGHEAVGIRLDSGDLDALSRQARRMLDQAGFPGVKIVASGELDEHRIARLRAAAAPIDIWGVGTRLTTAFDEPALGGVYKLSAVRDPNQPWQHRVKRSDDPAKSTDPGVQQIRRYERDGQYLADVIFDVATPPRHDVPAVDRGTGRDLPLPDDARHVDLLVPVFRDGRCVYQPPPLAALREHSLSELNRLPPAVKRLTGAQVYPVGLERRLHELKSRLLDQGG